MDVLLELEGEKTTVQGEKTTVQPQSIDTATEVIMCQQARGRKGQVLQPCSGQIVWQVWAKLLAAVAAPAPPLGNGFAQRARRPAMARDLLVQRKSAVARDPLVPVVAGDPLVPVVAIRESGPPMY